MTKDTKEHILEVSLTLFLQKGYKGVTMKEIVEKTGLSKGAFYYYFESKQHVFTEVVTYYFVNESFSDFDNFDQSSLKKFYNQFIEGHYKQVVDFEKKNYAISKN